MTAWYMKYALRNTILKACTRDKKISNQQLCFHNSYMYSPTRLGLEGLNIFDFTLLKTPQTIRKIWPIFEFVKAALISFIEGLRSIFCTSYLRFRPISAWRFLNKVSLGSSTYLSSLGSGSMRKSGYLWWFLSELLLTFEFKSNLSYLN